MDDILMYKNSLRKRKRRKKSDAVNNARVYAYLYCKQNGIESTSGYVPTEEELKKAKKKIDKEKADKTADRGKDILMSMIKKKRDKKKNNKEND